MSHGLAASGPGNRPLLVLLLDGVAHERMAGLHRAGYFRRFSPPARLISVFPTLTDPAFDTFFASGPTPGYEAGYFRRSRNRNTAALWFYLSGGNERWVRYSDYRLNFVEDGLMYLLPRQVFHSELRRARRVFDRRLRQGASTIVLYLLSTDALGHMLPAAEIDAELIRLDAWIERLHRDVDQRLSLVMFSDHGISAWPPAQGYLQPCDLRSVLQAAGLRVTNRLRRPGDVVMPLFGLLDVARMHAFDEATRDAVAASLRGLPQVELVAARQRDAVRVCVGRDEAVIHSRLATSGARRYRCQNRVGDPLGVDVARCRLQAERLVDDAGFADWDAWLQATAALAFPAAVPRLWDGLFDIAEEQPDVVVSMAAGWFVGSGLFNRFVRMHGTHGGLHRRVSETFAMATDIGLPRVLSLPALREILCRAAGWPRRLSTVTADVANRRKPALTDARAAESATIDTGDAGMGEVTDRYGPSSSGGRP